MDLSRMHKCTHAMNRGRVVSIGEGQLVKKSRKAPWQVAPHLGLCWCGNLA